MVSFQIGQNCGAQTRGEAPSPSFATLARPLPPRRGEVAKLSRSLGAIFRPGRQINRFKISAPHDCGALFSSSLCYRKQKEAERRQTLCTNLRTGRCGARPVSCPSPICGGGFRAGTLACRRPTAALAKGTYVTFGATQAMLPGTWSERVLPAFACPSPVSTSRADRSIGRHDARAGRGTGRILPPAATAPAPHSRIPSRKASLNERDHSPCNGYRDECQEVVSTIVTSSCSGLAGAHPAVHTDIGLSLGISTGGLIIPQL
jgi:hypothetical protein